MLFKTPNDTTISRFIRKMRSCEVLSRVTLQSHYVIRRFDATTKHATLLISSLL